MHDVLREMEREAVYSDEDMSDVSLSGKARSLDTPYSDPINGQEEDDLDIDLSGEPQEWPFLM